MKILYIWDCYQSICMHYVKGNKSDVFSSLQVMFDRPWSNFKPFLVSIIEGKIQTVFGEHEDHKL